MFVFQNIQINERQNIQKIVCSATLVQLLNNLTNYDFFFKNVQIKGGSFKSFLHEDLIPVCHTVKKKFFVNVPGIVSHYIKSQLVLAFLQVWDQNIVICYHIPLWNSLAESEEQIINVGNVVFFFVNDFGEFEQVWVGDELSLVSQWIFKVVFAKAPNVLESKQIVTLKTFDDEFFTN